MYCGICIYSSGFWPHTLLALHTTVHHWIYRIVPEDIAKQINREAMILCSLNHPNIIRIFGVVLNRGWIIMELCVYGSLRSILLDKDNAFETPELIRFASETATGVAYLHATGVAYGMKLRRQPQVTITCFRPNSNPHPNPGLHPKPSP